MGDLNRDGRIDILLPTGAPGSLLHLRPESPERVLDATSNSGLGMISNPVTCALGDFDNDEVPDLFVVSPSGNRLLKGKPDGTFDDITQSAGMAGSAGDNRAALFLDADHDGDLDVFVSNTSANQLWNNNGNGEFTNIAAQAGLQCADGGSRLALPGDVDGDRDMDLVILRQGSPAQLFLNELLGQYRASDLRGLEIRGEAGGALQDFNGDGLLDLLVLGGEPRALKLFAGDGRGQFRATDALTSTSKTAGSRGSTAGFRAADLDLDGDLDIVCYGSELLFLLNDGKGRFVVQAQPWKPGPDLTLQSIEVCDATGDLVPDILFVEQALGTTNRLLLAVGELAPPSTALAIQPSGIRGRDGRTRSPASGFGVTITARSGLHEHRVFLTGQNGGPNQSLLPVVVGLAGASKADFVQLHWPDGVAQVEMGLAAGQTHQIAELQRKISSCPVLFAWNGERFAFVTDFAGVGGLGYFSAPGVSAPPQVQEHVKIESGQLQVRNGHYELRVTEPMEEAAYVDRLELQVIDHPTSQPVFPDERLAISGPAPTHELLVAEQPWFPTRALDPAGRDCTANLLHVDRVYAYEPELDRRYIGFCQPHSLEVDFGEQLLGLKTGDRVFLFINGYIEYPYSQTVYAASQSHIGWEPIRVDILTAEGRWKTIVPDAGAPGGMARMMTIDLSGQIDPATRRLRLTTNLEIRYDQVFASRTAPRERATVRTVPLREATLRYAGFALEYSPDGRQPLIYDYDRSQATAPFHTLKGAYTRYGPVERLLEQFDDRYVIVGPGDEIVLRFDASRLPPLSAGFSRSFILVSHAYCKDMDLYTATPRTLEPLPFMNMTRYPYPSTERYPDSPGHRDFLQEYNTRIID